MIRIFVIFMYAYFFLSPHIALAGPSQAEGEQALVLLVRMRAASSEFEVRRILTEFLEIQNYEWPAVSASCPSYKLPLNLGAPDFFELRPISSFERDEIRFSAISKERIQADHRILNAVARLMGSHLAEDLQSKLTLTSSDLQVLRLILHNVVTDKAVRWGGGVLMDMVERLEWKKSDFSNLYPGDGGLADSFHSARFLDKVRRRAREVSVAMTAGALITSAGYLGFKSLYSVAPKVIRYFGDHSSGISTAAITGAALGLCVFTVGKLSEARAKKKNLK